ncbi:ROK family protein [uncultured Mucilaginibacter sp.]|uniref:ROK family protein n=1 Tax=uncultured Mucilaginibacter sp. TaxID=797541 RepID=UPI0025FF1E6D|nr:ROK family protein [uncultured Mucilaginibacter sp.]
MSIKIAGIDLGATNIRGAIVSNKILSDVVSAKIHSNGPVEEVLNDIYQVLDALIDNSVQAIGIGVPSVVDIDKGIVYDVQYIPSWKEVPLKKHLEARYHLPVFVNNDANCFAVGEYHFGKNREVKSMIGLTIGTGLGAGVIINEKLFAGNNCGAGEFGLFNYLDNILEFYCSGSFFQNLYGIDGAQVFIDAKSGNQQALAWYGELGTHIGYAIKMIMYAYDPQLVVLGGSASLAFDLFKDNMWQEIKTLAYPKSAERIRVEPSVLANSAILGAAALYFDAQ